MIRKPNSSGLSVGINNFCLTSPITGIARVPATAPAAAVRNLRRLMKDIGALSPFLIQISFQGIRLPFILLRTPSASVRRVQLEVRVKQRRRREDCISFKGSDRFREIHSEKSLLFQH